MQRVFVATCVLAVFALAGCRPAGTPVPNTPASSRTSPLPPTPIVPQGVPEATREGSPSPVRTPFAASGIHLTATLGPTCPGPERPGQACIRPYEGLFVVTDNTGVEVARASTNQNGTATIDLPPGDYIIAPKIEGRFPSGAPTAVAVPAGQFVEVSIELDSGIR